MHAYKKAARKAPSPMKLPATPLATAAPLDCVEAPVPVGEPDARVPDAAAPLPVGLAPAEVGAPRMMVVLLFALTTTVWVALTLVEGPGRRRVWMPVPTAGMEFTGGCAVTIAGWLFWAGGRLGWLVATAG